jgi:hypothetical protein
MNFAGRLLGVVHQILDLDLDFFLDRIKHRASDRGKRPDSSDFIPWSTSQVRFFLEQQCFLSTASPTRGKLVTHHDEVFWLWRTLVENGQIGVPFEVIHVDAHADLGLGDASHKYIMSCLLHKPLKERSYPNSKEVGPGNFLAFAVACRWISQIKFVLHPGWRDDLPISHFRGFSTESGYLELKKCTKEEFERSHWEGLECISPLELDPPVPFETISCSEFKADGPPSFVFLAQSPGFTPETADALIPIIKEYISEI